MLILDQRAVRAYQAEDYARAIAFLDALEQVGGLRRDLDVLRAFAYNEVGQIVRSREAFRRLDDELSTPETRQGLLSIPQAGPQEGRVMPLPRQTTQGR